MNFEASRYQGSSTLANYPRVDPLTMNNKYRIRKYCSKVSINFEKLINCWRKNNQRKIELK